MSTAYKLENMSQEHYELDTPPYKLCVDGGDEEDVVETERRIPVQPLIGDEIRKAKFYLLNRPERFKGIALKQYVLFCFGISVGLRIGDLLSLKIYDVVKKGEVKDSMVIKEKKNKRIKEIFFRPTLKTLLAQYLNSIDGWKYNHYLFPPRNNPYKQMTRDNVNKLMKNIQTALNLDVPLGTHSLRKTFARAVYDLMVSKGDMLALEKLQDIMGHKDVSTTRRYIGLQREGARDIYLNDDLCI